MEAFSTKTVRNCGRKLILQDVSAYCGFLESQKLEGPRKPGTRLFPMFSPKRPLKLAKGRCLSGRERKMAKAIGLVTSLPREPGRLANSNCRPRFRTQTEQGKSRIVAGCLPKKPQSVGHFTPRAGCHAFAARSRQMQPRQTAWPGTVVPKREGGQAAKSC
jgi:hypothetical protein